MKWGWKKWTLALFPIVGLGFDHASAEGGEPANLTLPGAPLVTLADDLLFTEGPVPDKAGNVYFTDIRANRIYIWSLEGKRSLFREDPGGANGLYFDADGNLLACEGKKKRVVSIAPDGAVTVLADSYDGKPLNQPNDLWVDPKGGVYFSDPVYGKGPLTQDGEHLYYLTPDRTRVIRVIDDMVRPNGLMGTPNGRVLYVADHGAQKTYRYAINEDGTLAEKTLFAERGCDGMTIDEKGNVYLTDDVVAIYNPEGKLVQEIATPARPANVCFGGKERTTLFITARNFLLSIEMSVRTGTEADVKKKLNRD